MAFGTISLIPDKVEPFFWLIIFVICAYFIAKTVSGKYFLHGFVLSLFNCVWIMLAHILFYRTYADNHPEMVKAFAGTLPTHPRVLMLIVGPFMGAAFGLVQGLFAFIASKIVKKSNAAQ